MSDLRIFSYLPNPRIWKATIAARLCSVDVEVRGSSPTELASWRWDFDARPLTPDEHAASADVRAGTVGFKGSSLRKTAAFMIAHPFGTVPAAFSPDGKTGIFESNSIMRAVARLGERTLPLYGRDAYEASRIDSFLDASLVFALGKSIPGDPVKIFLSQADINNSALVEQLRQKYALDSPLPVQYWKWLSLAIRGESFWPHSAFCEPQPSGSSRTGCSQQWTTASANGSGW